MDLGCGTASCIAELGAMSVEAALITSTDSTESGQRERGQNLGKLIHLSCDGATGVALLELHGPQRFSTLGWAIMDDMHRAVIYLKNRYGALRSVTLQGAGVMFCTDGTMVKVASLKAHTEDEVNCTLSQLAIAWCLKNEDVTTCLLGATKPSQLSETLEAIAIARRLTPENMQAIEETLGNKPAEVYRDATGKLAFPATYVGRVRLAHSFLRLVTECTGLVEVNSISTPTRGPFEFIMTSLFRDDLFAGSRRG